MILISSSKSHTLEARQAFGNKTALAGVYDQLILPSALPRKLYPSTLPSAAGTNPRVPLRDPETSHLREKLADLEKEVAQIRRELDEARSRRAVALTSLGDSRYRLRHTLWAEVDVTDDNATAHVSELEEYGSGPTEYEALQDLRIVLVETFIFLSENEKNLGPAPAQQLLRFREVMETP